MNWYKAKTVLIVFFVITNTFLLFNVISNGRNDTRIAEEVLEYTAEVLANNGIKIDKERIPKKKRRARQVETDNIITGYDEFALMVLGEDYKKLSETEYESAGGTLSFSGDYFCYNGKSEYPAGEEGDVKLLRDMGLEISGFEYDAGVFSKKINRLSVFNSQITVEHLEDSAVRVSGVWFEENESKLSDAGTVKPITSVLIDFISSPERSGENVEITDLEWGYMVYETEIYHKSIVPVPVWKIEMSDGKNVYMEAQNN